MQRYPRPQLRISLRLSACAWLMSFAVIAPLACGQAAPGSLDVNFDPGTQLNGQVLAVTVQPDGKVIVGGDFADASSRGARRYVARLNADGSADTAFNPAKDATSIVGAGFNNEVSSVALQADGKIIVGGKFTQIDNETHKGLARLNADGSLDHSFAPVPDSGISIGSVSAVAVQADGKIVIGGQFTTVNNVARQSIARLNADGSLDTGFDPGDGAGTFRPVNALAILSDGKIVIGGSFDAVDGMPHTMNLARLNADGTVDKGFDAGLTSDASVDSVTVQADGKILLTGVFLNVLRLDADGRLDSGFKLGLDVDNPIESLALQPDGKILLGGSFTTIKGVDSRCIARLNTDGSLDADFVPGTVTGGLFSVVKALTVQPNGKILLGGDFTDVAGTTRNYLARLSGDTTATSLPTVTLEAVQDSSESGQVGQMRLSRTGGDVNADLIVRVAFAGTATNGVDYVFKKDTIKLKAGKTSKIVKFVPIDDAQAEGTEKVAVKLLADPAYTISSDTPAKVKIKLLDND